VNFAEIYRFFLTTPWVGKVYFVNRGEDFFCPTTEGHSLPNPDREVPISPLLRIVTRTVFLTVLAAAPYERLVGTPSEEISNVPAKGAFVPEAMPEVPVGDAEASEPVLFPTPPEYITPIPAAAPVPLDEPMPRWLLAWDGETPASLPSRAAAFSAKDSDAYADWLRSTLPEGCSVRRQWALVTAYCPCAICCDERTGRTATGRLTDVHPYGIAADWRVMRRGTKLHVPGYLTESTVGGVWEIDDTGGALRRSRARGVLHLDVRFVAHGWAERWGTRRMSVYVVDGPAVVH
jgi:3D (Asp-Asp-Asp) domain-containing protein